MKKQVVWAHGLVWGNIVSRCGSRGSRSMRCSHCIRDREQRCMLLSSWLPPLHSCSISAHGHGATHSGPVFTPQTSLETLLQIHTGPFFSDGSKYRQADDQLSQVDWVLLMGTGYSLQPSLSVHYKHRGWLAMVFGHLHGILNANWPSSLRQMKIIKPQEFVVLSLLPPMLRDAQGCWQGCVT